MKIEVKKEYFENSEYCSIINCAMAQASKLVFPESTITVGDNYIRVDGEQIYFSEEDANLIENTYSNPQDIIVTLIKL